MTAHQVFDDNADPGATTGSTEPRRRRLAPATAGKTLGLPRGVWCTRALVASLLLSGALGLSVFVLRSQLDEVMAAFRDATATVAQLSSELDVTRRDADLLVDTMGVLRSADLLRVELSGSADGVGARGRAFLSRNRGVVLHAQGLPVPGAGRTYQVWVMSDTVSVSIGTFDVNPFGMSTMARSLPTDFAVVSSLTVTLEPSGGSPAPTSAPLLAGSVAGN